MRWRPSSSSPSPGEAFEEGLDFERCLSGVGGAVERAHSEAPYRNESFIHWIGRQPKALQRVRPQEDGPIGLCEHNDRRDLVAIDPGFGNAQVPSNDALVCSVELTSETSCHTNAPEQVFCGPGISSARVDDGFDPFQSIAGLRANLERGREGAHTRPAYESTEIA